MVSKIHLSQAEAELFANAEIILTKNRIIQKIIQLLEGVQNEMLQQESGSFQFSVGPKISKGENYLGLPYVILDYPRESAGGNLFFVRSMFWWGNFFSSTLHVSGSYKQNFLPALISSFSGFAAHNYYIGVHTNPWIHHFEKDNFTSISNLGEEKYIEILRRQEHIKIAAKWPLTEWDSAANLLLESRKLLIASIT